MAQRSFRLCHWTLLLLSEMILSSSAGWARSMDAADAAVAMDYSNDVALDDRAAERSPSDLILILSVTVNGQDRGLAQFHMADGTLFASHDTLQRIGLRLPPDMDAIVRLDELAGVVMHYAEETQAISLTVPVDMLAAGMTQIDMTPERSPRATSSTGLLLNYNAYANYAGGETSFNSFTELRAFSGNNVLNSTALLNAGAGRSSVVRLDSAWTTSFPDKMLTLRVGDTLTAATEWSRATRIGGVQFGTNFALQPYLVTVPMSSFTGSATLPSKVDLYIEGVRRYSGEIAAGPFALNPGAGSINGAGTAQIVLTDMLGQVSTLNFSLYDTPRLLRRGLSDWSVEAGFVRRNYGLTSLDYGTDPVVSGTWQRGLTNRLTARVHGEAGPSVVNFGIGGAWLLGARGGVVSASVAGSRADDLNGHQWSLGYSWSNRRLNFALETLRSSDAYADIATRWSLPPPRARDYAQIGYDTRVVGSFGLTYLHQKYRDQESYRYAGLYWSQSLGRQFSLNLSGNQNLNNRHDRAFFVSLNFTPRARDYYSAGYAHQNGSNSANISAQRSVPQSGGLGWRVDARQSDAGTAGTAQVNYLNSAGEAHAGISAGKGVTAGFLGYTGSLVLMDGHVFAARRIDDSFAVVSTGDVADVPVKLENNVVGRTGADGLLLVPRLNAYQRNMLAIDPTDLPVTARIDQIEQFAVPTDRSGVMVRFPIGSFGAVIMTLTDSDGQIVPQGTAVHIEGREDAPLIVGFDGQLYIENPRANDILSIELPGGMCRVPLPASPPVNSIDRLGTVRCLQEQAP